LTLCICGRAPRPAYVCHHTEPFAAEGNTVKVGAKWIVKNVSVRTDNSRVLFLGDSVTLVDTVINVPAP